MNSLNTINELIDFIKKTITIYLSKETAIEPEVYYKICDRFREQIIRDIKCRGLVTTIKMHKEKRLIFTRWLSGKPIYKSDMMIGLDKFGYPKSFRIFQTLDLNNKHNLRFLMSILNLTRALQGDSNTPVSTDSITLPWKGTDKSITDKEIRGSIKKLISKDLLSQVTSIAKEFYMSSKTSPSGNPALPSSVSEAISILKNHENLIENIEILSGPFIPKAIKLVGQSDPSIVSKYLKNNNDTLGRVTQIPDKEMKVRNIAILDYWSQTSLRPLHTSLLRILSNIKMDMTYDQAAIPLNSIRGRKVYSYDLSSATDRFPIVLQQRILSFIIGQRKCEAWSYILTQRDYIHQQAKTTIKYNCGQPMGAFSSWAAFTLSHHLVVTIAYYRAHKNYYGLSEAYRILGDDIIIMDAPCAEEYGLIMRELDVEISPVKSHVSNKVFELAKRWFIYNGTNYDEITGFPLAGIKTTATVPHEVASYIKTALKHGWSDYNDVLTSPDVLTAISSSFNIRINKSYIKDFKYSVFGVNQYQGTSSFCKELRWLNPYCETGTQRFEKLVSDAFMFSVLRIHGKAIKNMDTKLFRARETTLADDIKKCFISKGLDTSIYGNRLEVYFPHYLVWHEFYNQLNSDLYSLIDAMVAYDDINYAKTKKDGKSFYDYLEVASRILLSEPDLDKINHLNKHQRVLAMNVKLTRSLVDILGDISILYDEKRRPIEVEDSFESEMFVW